MSRVRRCEYQRLWSRCMVARISCRGLGSSAGLHLRDVASPEVWATLNKMSFYTLEPVGFIRSTLKRREEASREGPEGAPEFSVVQTGGDQGSLAVGRSAALRCHC